MGKRSALATVASMQGNAARAVRLAVAATTLREAISTPRSARDEVVVERGLTPARQALGEDVLALAWAEG